MSTKVHMYFLMVFLRMLELMIFRNFWRGGVKLQSSRFLNNIKVALSQESLNFQDYSKQRAVCLIQENTPCIKTELGLNPKTSNKNILMLIVGFVKRMRNLIDLYWFTEGNTA